MKKYSLTETQIKKIANLAVQENGESAISEEVSLMANLFELQTKYTDIYSYVRNGGWFYKAAYYMDNGSSSSSAVSRTKDVLVNGNRTLPVYVNEHDCFSDISSVTNNGKSFAKTDRSQYKKDVTVIKNRYGSTYKFYCFPSAYSDPFGYTAEAYEKANGSSNTNNSTKKVISTASALSRAKTLLRMNQSETMTGYTPTGKSYFVNSKAWYTTPKKGDVVYFYSANKGRVGHTGIVKGVNVTKKTFTTIEGNTQSTSYSENGGCVATHSYSYASIGGTNRVNGFGRPDFFGAGVTASKFVSTAQSYVGYMEKKSNASLDSKTANVGSNNYQKFQRDVGAGNGDQWCQYFVDAIALYTCQVPSSSSASTTSSSESSLSKKLKFVGTVKVNTSLRVREWAGTEYPEVSFSPLKNGYKVNVYDTVLDSNGDKWYYLSYNGKYGFSSAKYITK